MYKDSVNTCKINNSLDFLDDYVLMIERRFNVNINKSEKNELLRKSKINTTIKQDLWKFKS